jgi:hypothetical protein
MHTTQLLSVLEVQVCEQHTVYQTLVLKPL